uniref:Uncharacterized protein n=1 Tax=Anguilla anguilla TaxID=7936 RepID=A0A0E9S3Y3_ANGAN
MKSNGWYFYIKNLKGLSDIQPTPGPLLSLASKTSQQYCIGIIATT